MTRRGFFRWLGIGGLLAAGGAFAVRRANAGNPYYSGPAASNFDGRTFFNPGGDEPRGFTDLLRWQLGGGKEPWPETYPSPFEPAKPEPRMGGDGLRVTMVGHATMLVQVAGLNLLTDPVWSERVSPFSFAGPYRRNAPGIAFDDLPPIDAVLLTHNHYDHLDLATLERLVAAHDPHIVTPLGNDTIIRQTAPTARLSTGNWGDVVRLGDSARVHIEPAHHWSARGGNDRRMALWSAFVIETPAGKIYHVGDTGFHDGINYRAAGEKHGGFRLALLPIGAYEPRWFMQGQHQNPFEAVQGMALCRAAHTAGHHWGTFRLTNEAVEAPLQALEGALQNVGITPDRFQPMRPGQVWDVPSGATA
ncbi:MAG: MBL fold metallo-hydrolase [Roseitalea sp.]|nr:MBL fold metallo-hydrolase [Roseitalea sp.]MBO6721838.1 MBL fold metallo-hydrolase [Roseitalea sp.]MBO6744848.1 MBL fold metallo-hydrolase [Roseitalea sp.]